MPPAALGVSAGANLGEQAVGLAQLPHPALLVAASGRQLSKLNVDVGLKRPCAGAVDEFYGAGPADWCPTPVSPSGACRPQEAFADSFGLAWALTL